MKLYVINPVSSCCAVVRVAAELTGQKVETVVVDDAMRKSADFKAKNVTDKFPLLETAEGCLSESSAICVYLATLAGKNLGANAVERALVDQWISFANTSIVPTAGKVATGIFGTGEISQPDWNDAAKNLKAHCKVINTALEGKQWLAGAEVSMADIVLANSLITSLQTVLDGGFRKAMKNVEAWAKACFALPCFVKIMGNIQMCAKPLKPVTVAEKKPEKKKAAAPAPKKEEKKKEEKPKDNVESLPPSPFGLYDFKTLFVNHPDKKGEGVDTFYKMLDWEGWSFWFFHYDKLPEEGKKLHVTSNFLTGFMNRAEHTSKYTFGRMGVLGEEPDLEVMGCWLVRGLEIPDGLAKEHAQFEYFHTKKLDPRNNKDDDKMVREFFGSKEEELVNGLKAQVLKWQK